MLYTLFNIEIDDLKKEELDWFESFFVGLYDLDDYDLSNPNDRKEFIERYEEAVVEVCEKTDYLDNNSIKYSISGGMSWRLRMYSNDYGDPVLAAEIISAFLKKFRPTETHIFTWACVNNLNLRETNPSSQFSGGAAFITADFVFTQPNIEQMKKLADQYENDKLENPSQEIGISDLKLKRL